MQGDPNNLYDQVAYPSWPYSFSHPERLRTLGLLHNLTPPPVEGSRVLEIGCGAGGNLVPMAAWVPDAEFVGIDLAETAIEVASQRAESCGVHNVRFVHADLTEIGTSLGQFDYVVAHGVLSWVPEPVRRSLIQLVADVLTPDGVAMVSFNTLPGWHLAEVARTILRIHGDRFDDPMERVKQGKALLTVAATQLANVDLPWKHVVTELAAQLEEAVDSYVFHDHLAPVNHPMLFREFNELLQEHDLAYVSDALIRTMMDSREPEGISLLLDMHCRTLVEREQYRDLLLGTAFRRALVCRGTHRDRRAKQPESVQQLYVQAEADPQQMSWNLNPGDEAEFKSATGTKFGVKSTVAKTALTVLLKNKPSFISFDELRTQVDEVIANASLEPDVDLGEAMLFCHDHNLVELATRPMNLFPRVSERPVVHPYVRRACEQGFDCIGSPLHVKMDLRTFDHRFLMRLDGTRDVDAITSALLDDLADGTLEIEVEGADVDPTEDLESYKGAIRSLVVGQLDVYKDLGLFVA